jgi:aspartate carbamoyltransferase catalytic subunit
VKGETLIDTARNIEAMQADIIVLRHSSPGAAEHLARFVQSSVINAGDGWHEHPTQALLDLYTIKEKKGKVGGLTIVIVGDVAHSRVARSNIAGLAKLGAEVRVVAPPTMLPLFVERLGARVFYRFEDALIGADAIMMLRLQRERLGRALLPGMREYANLFCLNEERLKLAKPEAIVMHPGPLNRGIEISPAVADSPGAVILDQVTNGVSVRMALMYLLSGAT